MAVESLAGLDSVYAIGNDLEIAQNSALESLRTIQDEFRVVYIIALPPCEICDLMARLRTVPETYFAQSNGRDSCANDCKSDE